MINKNRRVVGEQRLFPALDMEATDFSIAEPNTERQREKTTGGGTKYSQPNAGFSYTPYTRSGFSYKDAPEYVNRYQQQIDDLSNRILHAQGFSYNVDADPLYQQYSEQYNRNGQNAMRNALAQISARTGGMASSYAGTAAQNAYNSYMQELNDKVPELYQLAYGMYNDRINKQRNDLSMLEALEQGDYAKYADLLGQYNTDRNLAYNVWNATESAKENANDTAQSYAYKVWLAQQEAAENNYKSEIKFLQDALERAQEAESESSGNNQETAEPEYSGTGGYTKEDDQQSTTEQVMSVIKQMSDNGASPEETYAAYQEALDSGLIPANTGSAAIDSVINRMNEFIRKNKNGGDIRKNNAANGGR